MIDAKDLGTAQMPLVVKRGRGRPRKADALTPAQRAAAYRARRGRVMPLDLVNDLRSRSDDRIEGLERENALLLDERSKAWAEVNRLAEEVGSLKHQLASSKRDVTKNADTSESRALASLAETLRRFSRDQGAIIKPRQLQEWARTLEHLAGVK